LFGSGGMTVRTDIRSGRQTAGHSAQDRPGWL
jgi:hypothetical protein